MPILFKSSDGDKYHSFHDVPGTIGNAGDYLFSIPIRLLSQLIIRQHFFQFHGITPLMMFLAGFSILIKCEVFMNFCKKPALLCIG